MKLRALLVADGANYTQDGRVNAIGLGARIITAPSLPVQGQLALIAAIDDDAKTAGPYAVQVRIEDPDGMVNKVVEGQLGIAGPRVHPELPSTVQMALPMPYVFRLAGVHRVIFEFGSISESIDVFVAVGAVETRREFGTAETPRRRTRSAKG